MKCIIMAVCLLLTACGTAYHKAQFLTGGYEAFKLDHNTYRVRFTGNRFSTAEQVYQFALRRSAELTKEAGYAYFKVLDTRSDKNTTIYITPVTKETHTQMNTYHDYASGYHKQTKTTVIGGNTVTVDHPSTSLEIRMYNTNVEGALDPNVILKNFEN